MGNSRSVVGVLNEVVGCGCHDFKFPKFYGKIVINCKGDEGLGRT